MLSPRNRMRTIQCVLTGANDQLEADGCILGASSDRRAILSPDHLVAGDYVKIHVWLPDEAQAIFISLAEVRRVSGHQLVVEAIQMSPQEREKLRQFGMTFRSSALHVLSDHVLVRA